MHASIKPQRALPNRSKAQLTPPPFLHLPPPKPAPRASSHDPIRASRPHHPRSSSQRSPIRRDSQPRLPPLDEGADPRARRGANGEGHLSLVLVLRDDGGGRGALESDAPAVHEVGDRVGEGGKLSRESADLFVLAVDAGRSSPVVPAVRVEDSGGRVGGGGRDGRCGEVGEGVLGLGRSWVPGREGERGLVRRGRAESEERRVGRFAVVGESAGTSVEGS